MKLKLRDLQQKVRHIRNLWRVINSGFSDFERIGQTPDEAYYALRALYVATNGWFNDIWQLQYASKNPPPKKLPVSNSMFAGIADRDIQRAVKAIKKDGYYVFPKLLPDTYIDDLTKLALSTKARLQSENYCSEAPEAIFDPKNLLATNYRLDEDDVVNADTVQAIIGDPAILEISRKVFQSQFRYGLSELWWTTPFKCDTPSSSLAQMYHYDMDRVKFLNFFIYLTDVTTDSGPHCFIKGSHSRKPASCLEDRRFSDEEIANNFPARDHVEITGPRGTLIIVDGRGFHKAKMPTAGNRLIFLLNMSSSLFGQNYPNPKIVLRHPKLISACRDNPGLAQRFEQFSVKPGEAKATTVLGRY